MLRRRSPLLWLASAGAFLLAACSGTPAVTPTTPPTHAPSPTPSPTPLPPDTLTVSVLADGVGTFDLAAFPVANLKNNATYHGAAMVVAHFVTHKSGRTLGSLESVAVNLGPGETLAVSAGYRGIAVRAPGRRVKNARTDYKGLPRQSLDSPAESQR